MKMLKEILQNVRETYRWYNNNKALEGRNWPKNPFEGGYFGWRFEALKDSIEMMKYDKRNKALDERLENGGK